MEILHDIYVNWFEGMASAYHIPEYHEWREDEVIELMATVPVIKVEPELFSLFENEYITVPQELLASVHKIAVRTNPETKRTRKVAYCFVVTDGNRALAIDTEGNTTTNLKSRLIPRHEEMVLMLAKRTEISVYALPEVVEEGLDDTEIGKLLDFDSSAFIGLTRSEKEMKEILFDCLFDLACSHDVYKLRYWYVELFPEKYEEPMSLNTAWTIEEMFNFIKHGWSQRHEEFGSQLTKFDTLYKDEWIELIKRNKDKDMVEA